MLTERQKEYIGVYAAIPSPNMFYWDLFREAREAYLGLGDTINLNEVMAEMKEAGIVPRDTELPPMTINGNVAVSITPDIVGNSVGISALDSINANRTDFVISTYLKFLIFDARRSGIITKLVDKLRYFSLHLTR